MTAVKRAMSILLSATMLMGNMVSPITAFAGETGTEGNEAYEAPAGEAGAEQPVTEAPDYLVTIPYEYSGIPEEKQRGERTQQLFLYSADAAVWNRGR